MATYASKAFTYIWHCLRAAVDALKLVLSNWLQTTILHPSNRGAFLSLLLQWLRIKPGAR